MSVGPERQSATVERASSDTRSMPPLETAGFFDSRLERGEKLLWSGRPRQGLMLRGSDLFVIPFSLVWCGFAVFWETMVATTGAPKFMLLWGGMFVVIGLYMVVGRFFADSMARARTYYALTNKRVLIVGGLLRQNVRSLLLRGLAEMNVSEGRNGRGTITFGPVGFQTSMGRGWPGANRAAPPAFEGIEEVDRVASLIRGAQDAA